MRHAVGTTCAQSGGLFRAQLRRGESDAWDRADNAVPTAHTRTVARTCARTHAGTPCTHAHKHVHMVRVAYTHVHAPLCAQMYDRHAAWRSARSLSPDRAYRVGMCMTGTTKTWSSCQGASAPAPAAVLQHARARACANKKTSAHTAPPACSAHLLRTR